MKKTVVRGFSTFVDPRIRSRITKHILRLTRNLPSVRDPASPVAERHDCGFRISPQAKQFACFTGPQMKIAPKGFSFVDPRRFELLTSSWPKRRSTNYAKGPSILSRSSRPLPDLRNRSLFIASIFVKYVSEYRI